MTTPQKDIDEIYKNSYQLVEDYLAMMNNFKDLKEIQKIGDNNIREIVFPVIAQYVGQDTSVPSNILTDYLQKKIKHWLPGHFRDGMTIKHREKMLEAFFQSADFQRFVSIINEDPHYKTQSTLISEDNIKKAFGSALNNDPEIMLGYKPISKQIWPTFVRHVQIAQARYGQPIDMKQYHQLQAQEIVETAQKYIHAMERAVSNGSQMSKERILERREQRHEDTITIETGVAASQEPEHIQKRAAP